MAFNSFTGNVTGNTEVIGLAIEIVQKQYRGVAFKPPLVKTPWRNIWRFFGGIKTANSNIWEIFGGNKTAGGEKIGNWGPVLRILAWKIA